MDETNMLIGTFKLEKGFKLINIESENNMK